MRTYGIEDIQGYDYPPGENAHRKSRARQNNKKEIDRQYQAYLKPDNFHLEDFWELENESIKYYKEYLKNDDSKNKLQTI